MEQEKRKTKIPGRREFLLDVTAAASAGWIGWRGARSSCAAEDKWDLSDTAQWRIGCFTRPWGQFDYRAALDAIAEAGFKYVGLMSTKPKGDAPWALVITTDTSVDEAQRAGDEARRRRLEIVSVYGGGIPVHRSLEAGIDGLRKLIDNCQAAKAPSLLMAGVNKQSLEELYYKAIAECCDYAAERQVELALKPHGPLNATGPACRKAIERVAHRNFRLWYDPGNILAYSGGALDPVDDAAAVDGLVTGMCIKDYDPAAGVKVTPGTGQVDFPRVLSRLNKGGFVGGPLVIETLAPGDPESLLREARKARRFVEKLVNGKEP